MKTLNIGGIDEDLISLINSAKNKKTCNSLAMLEDPNTHFLLQLGNPELYWEAVYLWRKHKPLRHYFYFKRIKILLNKDIKNLYTLLDTFKSIIANLYYWVFFNIIVTKNYNKYVLKPFKDRTGFNKTF